MLFRSRVAGDTLLPYAPSPVDCLHGWFGNRMRVNGELEPAFEVAPGWVRLQLLNACNARGLFIGMEDPSRAGELQTFHLLGVDGGLLEARKSVERLFLYGAERVDIAVALAPGAKRQVTSLAFDPRHQMSGHPVGHAHAARAGYRPLAAAEICAEQGAVAASLPDGARLPLFTLQSGTLPQKGEGQIGRAHV